MANGFQGPVDQRTMLQMQSAIGAERGFARMWSAGASPGVQAAYQQSAANKGALAANNIRMRYYKKEWEQIQETQIKPLTDQLFQAEQAYKQSTASTTMPVPRMIDPQEGQLLGDALQKQPTQITTVPGKATKEGTQSQEAVEQEGPPAPNAALGQGQIGALQHEDALAIMDPVTGSPVKLATARGIELMNKASYDFWEEHKRVNMAMMDTLSDYAGNPYAAQAQDGLMQNLQARAGAGATGSLDPRAQQEWMEGREQFDIEQAGREQDVAKSTFEFEQGQAQLQAQAADAQAMAADPKYAGYFKDSTLAKLQSGQPLTKKETAETAAVRNMLRDLETKDIALKARQGVFQIPASLVGKPENWERVLQRDDGYQHKYSLALMEAQNSMQAQLMNMSENEMRAALGSMGASSNIQDQAAAGLWSSPDVALFVNMLANTPEVAQAANDTAYLLTLPDIERQQSALSPVIDQTIEEGIRQIEASLASRGMPPLTEDKRQAMRADRYITFFELQTGRIAPPARDVRTEDAVLQQREQSSQLLQRRQAAVRALPPIVEGKSHGPWLTPEMAASEAAQTEARSVEELPAPEAEDSSLWNQILFPTKLHDAFRSILPGLADGRSLGTETTPAEITAASQE